MCVWSQTLRLKVCVWSQTLRLKVCVWSQTLHLKVCVWSQTLRLKVCVWSQTLRLKVCVWSQTLRLKVCVWSQTLRLKVCVWSQTLRLKVCIASFTFFADALNESGNLPIHNRDQFSLLTSLLSCLLITRLIISTYKAHILHDHILHPNPTQYPSLTTTLLLINSKLGVYWGKSLLMVS